MRTLIRNAAWSVLWDGQAHAYARGRDILIENGLITSITPHAAAPFDGEVIDAAGMLVLPGLVNIHAHPTTEPGMRGVREDHGVPEQQMSGLFERAQAYALDEAGREAAMRLAYAELMAAGVTSLVDLTAPFPAWMRVMRDSGLRVWAGPGFASARWGMTAPQTVTWSWDAQAGRRGFSAAQVLMDEAEADASGKLSAIVFPAQIDTVEEELLREAAALAKDTGRPFTIHIAQAVVEVREIIRRHNRTPIQWAAEIGLLSPTTVLGHCIFLDEHPSIAWHSRSDLSLLAEHGVAVAHCPTPFARYGEHLKDFGAYRARGVRMGMGTDCAPHNIIEEMRLAILLARDHEQRQHRQHRAVHRHRDADLVERDLVEEDFHVLDAVDRHTGLAHIARDARVVAVVATVRGQIESHADALPAGGQRLLVERVRCLGGREAGVLADRPGTNGIHRRLRAADIRSEAGQRVGVVQTLQIRSGVQRLDHQSFGRVPVQRVNLTSRR